MIINICFSSDNNYAKHMGVAITSILKNSNINDTYNFYVLDGGISDSNKSKLNSLKSTIRDFSIEYLEINPDDFKKCPMTGYVKYITLPTYYRFKIPSLLPNLDKVLYLDCDIVVNSDISELYNTNIDDYYVGGIPEVFNHHHKERLEILGSYYYINAGVLLINTKKWREDNIESKLFEYALNPKREIIFQDQDIINEVLMYNIRYIPLCWNLQHDILFEAEAYLINENEKNVALENPKLVHFTHKYKPWNYKCQNKFRKLYYNYLKQTPWKKDYLKIRFMKALSYIYSRTKTPEYQITTILGIRIKKYRIKNILNEIRQDIDKCYHQVKWQEHPLYCINNGVNTIFRYMSGLQLTQNYQTERVVVFEPNEAPIDHYERYHFVENYINENDDVLDIACGVGYGSAQIAKKAKSVLGVDINQPSISFANKIFAKENLSYKCANAIEVSFDKKYDKIISFETIEHIKEDKLFISKIINNLKDDGEFICSVPNQTIFPYNPLIVPFHVRHYTTEDITNLLESCGLTVIEYYYQYKNMGEKVLKKGTEEGYTIICIARKNK